METQKFIIFLTTASNTFSRQKVLFALFFLCFTFVVPAQIFQSENSVFYLSKEASVIEVENVQQKIITGKIYVTQNAIICNKDNELSAEIILIESEKKIFSSRKQLASTPKKKEIKSEKIAEPNNKNANFNFTSQKSDSSFLLSSIKKNAAISNTNYHTKAIFTKNTNFDLRKILDKSAVKLFIKNENYSFNIVPYFSIRPPPVV